MRQHLGTIDGALDSRWWAREIQVMEASGQEVHRGQWWAPSRTLLGHQLHLDRDHPLVILLHLEFHFVTQLGLHEKLGETWVIHLWAAEDKFCRWTCGHANVCGQNGNMRVGKMASRANQFINSNTNFVDVHRPQTD